MLSVNDTFSKTRFISGARGPSCSGSPSLKRRYETMTTQHSYRPPPPPSILSELQADLMAYSGRCADMTLDEYDNFMKEFTSDVDFLGLSKECLLSHQLSQSERTCFAMFYHALHLVKTAPPEPEPEENVSYSTHHLKGKRAAAKVTIIEQDAYEISTANVQDSELESFCFIPHGLNLEHFRPANLIGATHKAIEGKRRAFMGKARISEDIRLLIKEFLKQVFVGDAAKNYTFGLRVKGPGLTLLPDGVVAFLQIKISELVQPNPRLLEQGSRIPKQNKEFWFAMVSRYISDCLADARRSRWKSLDDDQYLDALQYGKFGFDVLNRWQANSNHRRIKSIPAEYDESHDDSERMNHPVEDEYIDAVAVEEEIVEDEVMNPHSQNGRRPTSSITQSRSFANESSMDDDRKPVLINSPVTSTQISQHGMRGRPRRHNRYLAAIQHGYRRK